MQFQSLNQMNTGMNTGMNTQAILTQQLNQFVDANYVPSVVGTKPISNYQEIQQLAPMVANACIQRIQNNIRTQPTNFTIATFNILSANAYNNTDFLAIIRIIGTILTNLALTQPNVSQNPGAYVNQVVTEYLSCAVAMMYQKYTSISAYFSPDIQQVIVAEVNRVAGMLNMQNQQQGMNMGVNMGMGMQPANNLIQQRSQGQLTNQQSFQYAGNSSVSLYGNGAGAGVMSRESANFGGGTMSAQSVKFEKYIAQDSDDYYTKANKKRRLDHLEVDDPAMFAKVMEEMKRLGKAEATAGKSVTVIAGSSDGVVIQSTRSGVNLNAPVRAESANVFQSNELVTTDAAEPDWDADWNKTAVSSDAFQSMIKDVKTPQVSQEDVRELGNKFFTKEHPENASGLPGIDKDGNVVFKKSITQAGEKMSDVLETSPWLRWSEVRANNLIWYPSNSQPVIPHYNADVEHLRFYPILEGDGLYAYVAPLPTKSEENMDYHKHGIGYHPAFKQIEVQQAVKAETNSTATPKEFRLKLRVEPSILFAESATSAYRDTCSMTEDGELNEREAILRQFVIGRKMAMGSKEEVEATQAILKKMEESKEISTFLACLDELTTSNQIPVRTFYARALGKQLTRLMKLRVGIQIEVDELETEGWEYIQNYINDNFYESLIEKLVKAEEGIIAEIMSGYSFAEEYGLAGDNDEFVVVAATVENVLNCSLLAAELELVENEEGFLIPEAANKLNKLATEALTKAGENYVTNPTSCVIITRDEFRIDVGYNLINESSIMGSLSRIS